AASIASQAPQPAVDRDIASALARWNSLRQSDRLPFSSYASFLLRHRGWPGEDGLRRAAERSIDPNSFAPRELISYFAQHPPLTPVGHARYASALLALGNIDEAREQARKAWHGGVLPPADEAQLLARFGGSLTAADHDRRIERLLANDDRTSAARVLTLTSPERRPFHEAQLALQAEAPDADSRYRALGQAALADPGVLMARANWLRNNARSVEARNLLAQRPRLARLPADPEEWFETLLTMARAAANDSQWTVAYEIASKLDDAYPPGTDISEQSYGERDDFTSLAWLAGTTALHKLGRPAEAARLFEAYARAARSPQTQTKGLYWAGRATAAAREEAAARAYFEEAARHPDQFYGQLALERLGREIPSPPLPRLAIGDAQRAAFERDELVRAIVMLGRMGQRKDQTDFIRALADRLESDEQRYLAGELAARVGRPDLGVWVARQARRGGENYYARSSFPTVAIPPVWQRQWALNHAIMRQESSFDREAVSPAGARGMMQLMPGTARETAGKLGQPYNLSRLTADPQYNIMLGSAYFANLLDQFGGYAPLAIAAYNAGPGNVRRWMRENGDPRLPQVDVVKWIEEIPFYETKNYVKRVLENAVVYDLVNPGAARSPARNRLSWYLGKRQPG
ncbi:MAG: lytic transglycosylase domain-containing protein, partial [Sphingomonadaceae bacterium]